MASSRHKHSRRKPSYHRLIGVVLPAGGVLALLLASLSVAFDGPDAATASAASVSAHVNASDLESDVSRSLDVRAPLPEAALKKVTGTKFATEDLDLHAGPDEDSPVLTEIKSGKKVAITGEVQGKWAEVVHKGTSRWVTAKFLSTKKPKPPKPPKPPEPTLSTAPCASSMGSGIQPDTERVHRAVCAKWPEITNYGGMRGGGGNHASGRAVDIMTSNAATGDAIAAFLRQHARELGISELIWRQRIWTVQRAGDGWRSMSDRGSATANHMDHVHVSTYGNSGTL